MDGGRGGATGGGAGSGATGVGGATRRARWKWRTCWRGWERRPAVAAVRATWRGTGGGTSACTGGVDAGPRGCFASRAVNTTTRSKIFSRETSRPADTFIPDEMFGHFAGNATSSVTLLGVEDYLNASEKITKNLAARLSSVVPCDPAKGDETCARTFVTKLAARAYARPLATDEIDALITVYRSLEAAATPAPTFADRISLVIQAVLQSPDFLYQPEKGQGTVARSCRSTPNELARRMALALWNSVARRDACSTRPPRECCRRPTNISTQVTRMMGDPKFLRAVDSFHSQWLGIHDSSAIAKDPVSLSRFHSRARRGGDHRDERVHPAPLPGRRWPSLHASFRAVFLFQSGLGQTLRRALSRHRDGVR